MKPLEQRPRFREPQIRGLQANLAGAIREGEAKDGAYAQLDLKTARQLVKVCEQARKPHVFEPLRTTEHRVKMQIILTHSLTVFAEQGEDPGEIAKEVMDLLLEHVNPLGMSVARITPLMVKDIE
jgi:hypothetical protein